MSTISGAEDSNSAERGLGSSPPPQQFPSGNRTYRFGEFELRADSGELYKRGIRVRLQSKPLQMLEELLKRPGELVTRDELVKKLWPATYVDFQSGLNTVINRLRAALGDSADAPRYVETLPRLGYRFVFPLTSSQAPGNTAAYAPVLASAGLLPVTSETPELKSVEPLAPAVDLPRAPVRAADSNKIWYFVLAGALLMIAAIVLLLAHNPIASVSKAVTPSRTDTCATARRCVPTVASSGGWYAS